MIVVRHADLVAWQITMLGILGVVMIPILACWIVDFYHACSDRVRRLFGAFILAVGTAGTIGSTQIIVSCDFYFLAIECWKWW